MKESKAQMKNRVADYIFSTLAELGIKDCFCVVGGGAMHLDNALAINDKIKTTFNHHEQACAMAADAYARLSGNVAAVCVTSGPGATNTLTGVMGAWQDNLPMIVISGNVRHEISVSSTGLPLRYRGVQEFDITNSIGNMTKYAKILKDPKEVVYEVKKAYKIAMSGRRGPVWIDVPLDIQNAIVDEKEIDRSEYNIELPEISDNEVGEIVKLLKEAKRPCIIAGSGIVSSDNRDNFERFLEDIKVPVVGAAWVADSFYNSHPLSYGLSGSIGLRTGNFILQNSDLIITLGSSLSFNQTGYNYKTFAPKAKIVMVDVDKNEYLKLKDMVDIFIHSDLKMFFNNFRKVKHQVIAPKEWFEYCNKLKNKFDPFEATKDLCEDELVCKYQFWKIFDEIAPMDVICAQGNSSCNAAKLQVGKRYFDQRVITNYMCGSMGYDLPAAIGCAVASKKEVLCITGDGSIMMNLQELETIKYNKFPVKVIVFTNNGYNAIRQTCKNFFNDLEFGCSAETGVGMPSFKKIAEAFEYKYDCCSTNVEIKEKLEWIFNTPGNLMLEIKEKLDDPLIPKIMSHIDENGNMVSPTLIDLYPFISEEEMNDLMLED